MQNTSEFNIVDSLVKGIGRTYHKIGKTLYWRMGAILSGCFPDIPARVEPRVAGCKSVVLTTLSHGCYAEVKVKVHLHLI